MPEVVLVAKTPFLVTMEEPVETPGPPGVQVEVEVAEPPQWLMWALLGL
jgi:hypothetical protein